MAPTAHPVIGELRDLCRLGLPAQSVMPIVMQALHRLVPSCTNLFDWVDAGGQIVDYYTEPPYVPDAARLYFDEFYNKRERELMAPYSERVRHGNGVLESCPPGQAFYRSDFYNLIWRPRGVHHSLEAVVRHGDRPVGALTLYRGAGEAPFGSRDRQALGAAIPYLAQLVANAADYRGQYTRTGPAGLLVVDRRGSVVYLCEQARHLLYLARRSAANSPSQAVEAEEPVLPEPLMAWCRDTIDAPGNDGPEAPTLQHQNAWGRFVFSRRWLEPRDAGARLIAIHIERQLPVSLNVARAALALPLSVRQRELCALLAEGLSYAEVAQRMNITAHTAISYARVVYDKLGLGGRDELARMLLAPAQDAH